MALYMHIVLLFILILKNLNDSVAQDDNLTRVESEVDESSCICGLNKEILDRLQSLLHIGASVCLSNQANHVVIPQTFGKQDEPGPQVTAARDPSETTIINPNAVSESKPELSKVEPTPTAETGQENVGVTPTMPTPQANNVGLAQKDDTATEPSTTNELTASQMNKPDVAQDVATNQANVEKEEKVNEHLLISYVLKLSSEISSLQSQISAITTSSLKNPPPSQNLVPSNIPTQIVAPTTVPALAITPSQGKQNPLNQIASGQTTTDQESPNHDKGESFKESGRGGPLSQLLMNLTVPGNNDALLQLNQSQKVEPQVMETALQTTVPNVVSNILTDLGKLETSQDVKGNNQTDTANDIDQGGKLTSVDGSSVEIQKGETSDQITSSGEKLFLKWVETQIETLHLTASVANHLRKSALMLFRRIVKQYVERMEKLGGNMSNNVRRATQLALENSQTLTSFLLKNYINFAGGLMQIIGEQVSRVGKQIDSTGSTISKVNLNPFDIVSNVIDSLPNPTDYSSYFRAFGKQLLGESKSETSTLPTEFGGLEDLTSEHEVEDGTQKQVEQPPKQGQRPQNLISKTMGALSKLFG